MPKKIVKKPRNPSSKTGKSSGARKTQPGGFGHCFDRGGTWDAKNKACRVKKGN
jgi:hypothetical protein